MKIKYNYLIILFLFSFTALPAANQLNVKVKGDSAAGFYVDLYYGTIPVSTQEKVGELNMVVENEDHSIREYVRDWKATTALQNGNILTLSGIVQLPKLETNVFLKVIYEVVNNQVVEKRIELMQTNLSLLYYSVNTSVSSTGSPSRFWSFDNADNKAVWRTSPIPLPDI